MIGRNEVGIGPAALIELKKKSLDELTHALETRKWMMNRSWDSIDVANRQDKDWQVKRIEVLEQAIAEHKMMDLLEEN